MPCTPTGVPDHSPPSQETSQRGQVISSGIEKNLLRFLEIVADKPIDQYVIEDRQRYRDILLQMPKGVNRPKYSDLSIEDIIACISKL